MLKLQQAAQNRNGVWKPVPGVWASGKAVNEATKEAIFPEARPSASARPSPELGKKLIKIVSCTVTMGPAPTPNTMKPVIMPVMLPV